MELGTIHPVSLRELWLGEATHFTPWLAKNLDVLGNKIGIDLELLSTETAVGDFSADITARDLSTNKLVVVENQYGATDHRHLGQIITYASHLGAGAVVWIAESIRPEHKFAIDFLNQNLKESLSVYAVQASVIRIDESKPAFVLTVVSMPSETISTPPDSETGEHYRSYFQQLIDTLRETYKFTNARIARPQNWYAFASENSRIYKYSTNFCRDGRIRVELYIDSGDKAKNEELFDCLLRRRSEIEQQLGVELEWERLDERRACRIAVYRDGEIDADSETLSEIQKWNIQNLLKFKSVFPSFVQQCS